MTIQWADAQEIKKSLVSEGWRTPDTYGNEYGRAENKPAVYLFLLHGRDDIYHDYDRAVVAYVGMSKRLKQRWNAHIVLQELAASGHYTQRWFAPTYKEKLRDRELKLIHRFDPPWNIQGRKRGVALR